MKIEKVISGGQTGADRAALDAAIACGVPHGGKCPAGRRAEDGVIPACYQLEETVSKHYPARTKANVIDSDVTVIFSHGPLTGGSLLTQEFAKQYEKPFVHVDLLQSVDLNTVLAGFKGVILNVAGPRESNDPLIYDAVCDYLVKLIRRSVV
jgi:hypothetical protein